MVQDTENIYLDSKALSYSATLLALVHLIPSLLVLAEMECKVHVAGPKWPVNQFKSAQQIGQHNLRAYCANVFIYTVGPE